MATMRSTALLLEIFERAGHTIEEYLQSQQPDGPDEISPFFGCIGFGDLAFLLKYTDSPLSFWKVQADQVERDVALMLKETGFILKFGDFDLKISYWFGKRSSLSLPSHHSPLMQQTKVVLPPRKDIPSGGRWPRPLTSPFHPTHALSSMKNINQVPNFAGLGSRYTTSFDVPVKKQTKAKRNVPTSLSRENVATLLKRGVRGY
ncbi:hypothetical protein RHMOL_Rhmol12G0248300 [Rhododendron molle]|uniref:Uncharacterized protein n=2 Tax=Rhododendron molle TaxID=49168 RepID=A0ACC0LM10_RHOML|nr:hypothetical protein RHMOL_Rhmol12G0248300 [Rhododendron molle]KAI8529736.1 hypothetical protein RHMOL_Rhmol12G0248300 [Rhododendron molle]